MCKFGCSNPVLLAGTGPGQFLSEKGRPTSTSSVQSISAWQQRWEKMGHIWDTYGISYGTIWASHSECWFQWEIWIKVCGTMWTYVNICEHHRWTSQNPQTLVSILIPLSLSLSLCFDVFFFAIWTLACSKALWFKWLFNPKVSFLFISHIERQVAKEGTCLVSGKHI